MPIFYALIAREKVVLAEWTGRMGNFPTVTRWLLNKVTTENQKMSYAYDKCVRGRGAAGRAGGRGRQRAAGRRGGARGRRAADA